MAQLSHHQRLLQGAVTQNVAKKHIRKDFSQSVYVFKRSTQSDNPSNLSKTGSITHIFLFVNTRAIPALNIFVPPASSFISPMPDLILNPALTLILTNNEF